MSLDKTQIAALLPAGDPTKYNKDTISTLVQNVLQYALDLVGVIAVVYILVGAFSYLTAYGSEEKATKGKNTITWAIIGLVFIAASKLILAAVWGQLTGVGLSNFLK